MATTSKVHINVSRAMIYAADDGQKCGKMHECVIVLCVIYA